MFASRLPVTLAAGLISGAFVSATHAEITFLHHFNDSASLDINPSNGDYAAGSGTATAIATPGSTTGLFPGSSPSNSALLIDNDFESVRYAAAGNVQLTSPTSGGITVGTWFKQDDLSRVGWLFTVGAAGRDDDYLGADFGAANPNVLRLSFRDGDGTNTTSILANPFNPTDWHYVAATVDLTNETLGLYVFDSTGNLIVNTPLTTAITVDSWNVPNGTINLGGRMVSGNEAFDEFSIDNVVLSQSELQQRVNDMVAGNQLVVPEPASLALLGVGSTLLATRRRC